MKSNQMRVGPAAALVLSLLLPLACSEPPAEPGELYRAPAISNELDGVVFEAGNWEPHLPAGDKGVSWGNHRAVVEVSPGEEAGAVLVTIPWRRHDRDPASKAVIVVDAATGTAVQNAAAVSVTNAEGVVVFQPNIGSSEYHVYYMPWQSTGSYYPTITYPTQAQLLEKSEDFSWAGLSPDPDPEWERQIRTRRPADLPQARTTMIQSVNDFHSFFPMEVIATDEEAAVFMRGAPDGWAVVPEHRDYPVRMRHFIPRHWTELAATATPTFSSQVLKGEAFTFQLALVSGDEPLSDVRVSFDGFPDSWFDVLTCFNCGGTDEQGVPFTKEIDVPAGTVQPLWIGIWIPDDQSAGVLEGTITVSSSNRGDRSTEVTLEVQNGRAVNSGFDEPELQTRLFWLNSIAGRNPDFIIAPFEPVTLQDRSLSILGRRVELGESGLPVEIFSYFTPDLGGVAEQPEPILARPLALEVSTAGGPSAAGGLESFVPAPFDIVREGRGRVRWTTASSSDRFRMTVEGALEYDGMLDYRIYLVALEDVEVEEIALPISLVPGAAEYMLGLGRKGGKRPLQLDWTWNVENHQEGAWLGGISRGLQYVLRDDGYVRPLNTNFYRNQPLLMPEAWYNGGRGGIRITEDADGSAVTALNYSGPRTLAAGDTLNFNVRFLITPFKPLDTATHFETRFVHQYVPVDSVRAWGGTVVNIHHANEINPYINYPFFNLEQQAAYIDEAHEKGIKVKLYNTIRELTYRANELFALRSLGDEILNDGEGGGHSWMQEHLESNYHSAWHAWRVDDAAMLNKGTSRWTNYYIEGLAWLAANQQIDGLYLDDIAFSRETVKRLVTVLHEHRDEVVIDLHSANQFNVRDGYINSAMLYMEHFPFISRLWFGEYFEYDLDADYWLTEVSGLPFGLLGEMLQDGGHPYRGLLYGMTARKYGDVDPRPVWAMMNEFGIADSRMLGYWLENAPIRTDNPKIRATTYARPGAALIALASWSAADEVVDLSVDLEALGLGPDARAWAPAVEGLQVEADVDLMAVRVPAGLGLFVVVESSY